MNIKAEKRNALNRYNGCVSPTLELDLTRVVDPIKDKRDKLVEALQKRDEAHKVLQKPDADTDSKFTTLDDKCQPRMPWQDVHVRIEGPAVSDLTLNFVLRWNSEGGKPKLDQATSSVKLSAGSGSCMVQVLRSAPEGMCSNEHALLTKDDQQRDDEPVKTQDNFACAMETLIAKAEHFIYIENQFFVSGFGEPNIDVELDKYTGPAAQIAKQAYWGALATRLLPGDSNGLPQNRICELLATRINNIIISEPDYPFHVYITLPVHPEGTLNNGTIVSQIHWTMQSLADILDARPSMTGLPSNNCAAWSKSLTMKFTHSS